MSRLAGGHQATSVSDAGETTSQRTPRDTNRALLPEHRAMINQDNERRERLLDQIDDVRKREVVSGGIGAARVVELRPSDRHLPDRHGQHGSR